MAVVLAEARRRGLLAVLTMDEGDHRLGALADAIPAVPDAAAGRAALRAELDLPRQGRAEGGRRG